MSTCILMFSVFLHLWSFGLRMLVDAGFGWLGSDLLVVFYFLWEVGGGSRCLLGGLWLWVVMAGFQLLFSRIFVSSLFLNE